MLDEDLRAHVRTLWDYHRLNQPLAPAEAVLVLCSHDVRVADYAAQLFLDAWAPRLIFSGGFGSITRRLLDRPEAEIFAERAAARGVPRSRILVENRSTNTGENIRFTRDLLAASGLSLDRFLVVQKPYMERRSYATFRKVWPEAHVTVTSPPGSLEDYLAHYSADALTEDEVVNILVGDLQRIKVYGENGFQIPQEVPGHVWAAYEALVRAGYDRRLVPAAG